MADEMVRASFCIFLFAICNSLISAESRSSQHKPCTYFGESRVSAPQGNLVNCSWYASNACCKRTEVTSVFGSMYSLAGATKDCSEKINYLMCYFCSPDQYRWYDRKVHVCAEYCRMLFEDCKAAQYDGTAIGEAYLTGEDFCRGQKFEVVEGKTQCFDFDPLVFDGTSTIVPAFVVIATSCLLPFILQTRRSLVQSSTGPRIDGRCTMGAAIVPQFRLLGGQARPLQD